MNTKEQYWKYSLIALILLLGVILFLKSTPFLGGILGASTIYLLVRNQMLYLTEKKKMKPGRVALLLLGESVLVFLIPLSLIIWLLIYKLQNINLDPNDLILKIGHVIDNIETKTGYNLLDRNTLSSIASKLPEIGQMLMNSITGLTVNLLVLLFVLYFMLTGGRRMEQYFYDLLPFNPQNKKNVAREIEVIVRSNAIGIPLLALIQGAVAYLGYLIFGAPNALLFGLLTCFATIVPIIGTSVVWIPLSLYMGLDGHWGMAAGMAAYCLIILTNVDNLTRFILQKKLADTHPLITIFGVVIGLSLFGFMGIIFGPLMLSIFILCIDIFKKEYLEKQR
ncbi:MAG: AI-2E family transporter [Coprobacter sp.]|nr:AI-2E family transporter [Coprobacter sp.]